MALPENPGIDWQQLHNAHLDRLASGTHCPSSQPAEYTLLGCLLIYLLHIPTWKLIAETCQQYLPTLQIFQAACQCIMWQSETWQGRQHGQGICTQPIAIALGVHPQ